MKDPDCYDRRSEKKKIKNGTKLKLRREFPVSTLLLLLLLLVNSLLLLQLLLLIATGHVRSRCSAIVGVSSSDWTLRIQVTRHDDDTVHCHDNSSALTGRWRVIDRT